MAQLKNTVIQDNAFLKVSVGNSSERPGSLESGMIRFNTDTGNAEIYNGTSWQKIVLGSTEGLVDFPDGIEIIGGSATKNGIYLENSDSISLSIDGQKELSFDSSGQFRMSNQPLFNVAKDNGNVTGTSTYVWNVVYDNVGGHYNTSNGRFTAPVSGIYFFSHYSIYGSNTAQNQLYFYFNGSNLIRTRDETRNGRWQTISSFWLWELNAGDYVDARASGGQIYGRNARWNRWSGWLVN